MGRGKNYYCTSLDTADAKVAACLRELARLLKKQERRRQQQRLRSNSMLSSTKPLRPPQRDSK